MEDRRLVREEALRRRPIRPVAEKIRTARTLQTRTQRTASHGSLKLPLHIDDICKFKTKPPTFSEPDSATSRLYVGRCCMSCFPISRGRFYSSALSMMGIRNCLHINKDTVLSVGFFFPFVGFYLKRDAHSYTPIDPKQVLRRECVQLAIQESASQSVLLTGITADDAIVDETKHAIDLLTKMASHMSWSVIGLTCACIFHLFRMFLRSIQVDQGQLEVIKKASKQGYPMVYLPIHRSHLDYFLIPYVLWFHGIKLPMTASGDNLSIPVVGTLLRKLGAFFIRRKMDEHPGRKDVLYRAVLRSYVQTLLENSHSLQIFIEGTRTRTGKPLLPKAGMLSIVVDTYNSGLIDNAFLVPIGLSYDRNLDGPFIDEQLGKSKVPENLFSCLRSIWNLLWSDHGNVRLDFAQPISLQEYLHESQGPSYSTYRDAPPRCVSSNSLTSMSVPSDRKYRCTLRGLSEHMLFSASCNTAAMCTQLCAFLLATKFRTTSNWTTLVREMDLMRRRLRDRSRHIGFSGDSEHVLVYALRFIGPSVMVLRSLRRLDNNGNYYDSVSHGVLMKLSIDEIRKQKLISNSCDNVGQIVIKPQFHDHVSALTISFFGSSISPIFALDSVVVTCLLVEAGVKLDVSMAIYHLPKEPTVSKLLLVDRCLKLYKLLSHEFIFVPPCLPLDVAVNDCIDRFVSLGYVSQRNNQAMAAEEERYRIHLLTDSWDGVDEDDEYQLIMYQRLQMNLFSPGVLGEFSFLKNVVAPYIEGYSFVAQHLDTIAGDHVPIQGFLDRLSQLGQRLVVKGLCMFAEAYNQDLYRNALNCFASHQILELALKDGVQVVNLTADYSDNEKRLSQLVCDIDSYVC